MLLIIWLVLLFYKKREYFGHSSGRRPPGKVKLTLASMKPLLTQDSTPDGDRYQQLYNSGKCSAVTLPPIYKRLSREQAASIKFCQCDQGSDVPGGLIPARNMPNGACSKDDFRRGGFI